MTIRAVPCRECLHVPDTVRLFDDLYSTGCSTPGCKMGTLACFGKDEDSSKTCWNNCMDQENP